MPTREQVLAALRDGGEEKAYVRAGEEWAIPAGRAYLIATGRPADASGGVDGRAQTLVNPREVNPTGRADVGEWIKRRAYADPSMRPTR